MPGSNSRPRSDHPGVYAVKPDRNTAAVGLLAVGILGWALNNLYDGMQESADKTQETAYEALRISRENSQLIEQQTRILETLPTRLEQSVQATSQVLQQRLDDMRAQASNAYTREAAQRDQAEMKAIVDQMRQEINANQTNISRISGRMDAQEGATNDLKRRLEQVYEAVISRNATPSAALVHPVYRGTIYEY